MGLGIEKFAKKLETVSGDFKAIVHGIAKAAFDTGNLDLQKAANSLKDLIASGNNSQVGSIRFAPKAPGVYSKGEVVGNFLASLYSSSSTKAKTLAVELATVLFKEGVANDVGIRGKYESKKVDKT